MNILDNIKKNPLIQVGFIFMTCIGLIYPTLSFFHNQKIEIQKGKHEMVIASKDLYVSKLKDSIDKLQNELRENKETSEKVKVLNNSDLTFTTSSNTDSNTLDKNNVSKNENINSPLKLYSTQDCNDIIKLFYAYGKRLGGSAVLNSTDKENMVKIWNQLENSCGEFYLKNSLGNSYKNYQIIMRSWAKE